MSDASDAVAEVAAALGTRWLGRAHRHHAETGSTNDDAAAWAAAGAPHGALVTADAQHAGRGRLGRAWHSPAGSHVYASVVLRPTTADARWSALGLAIGVGLRDGLRDGLLGASLEIGLKWPNDLLVGDRKLAGILCEARWIGGAPQIVVGFGINVRRQAWPAELRARAVTLEEMTGAAHRPAEVLVAVLEALEPVLDEFGARGFAGLRERYESACVSLGRVVRVSEADGRATEVFAAALDHDGALLVRDPGASRLRRVEAGELLMP